MKRRASNATAKRDYSPIDVPALTGLRGYAALSVFAFHSYQASEFRFFSGDGVIDFALSILFATGGLGVHIFFVLSGFLLIQPFALATLSREPLPSYRSYLRRRVLRVVPAYWFQVFVLTALAPLLGYALPSVLVLLAHLSFALNPEVRSINLVYWTLPIEFMFYLVLPFLARYFLAPYGFRPRALVVFTMVCCLIAIGYRFSMYHALQGTLLTTQIWAYVQLPGTLDDFACGMGAGALYIWRRYHFGADQSRAHKRWVSAVSLFGLFAFASLGSYLYVIRDQYFAGHPALFLLPTGFAIAIACVIWSIGQGVTWAKILFANPIALWLGAISYSVYLWHFPLLTATLQWEALAHMPLATKLWLITLPLTLIISSASYWWIERPFMRWRVGAQSPKLARTT